MDYKLAGKEDLQQLAVMRWDFQTEHETEIPIVEKDKFIKECREYLLTSLNNGDWHFWIARENDEVVSHIFVKTIRSVPRPARLENLWGYVTNVYTKPEFRGRGVGTELLRHLKLWAITHDFELLIVSPSDESDRFYKREGFTAETDFYQLRLREF